MRKGEVTYALFDGRLDLTYASLLPPDPPR